MSKVRTSEIDPKERKVMIASFLRTITEIDQKKDAVSFLLGMFTKSEALMFARRIAIAQMILEKHSYDDIRSALGVGYDTITKVERWLHSDDPNRDKWLEKCILKAQEEESKNKKTTQYHSALDHYPQHRFLKEVFGFFD